MSERRIWILIGLLLASMVAFAIMGLNAYIGRK